MRNTRAARRYAKALFAIALEQGKVPEVHRDLEAARLRLESIPTVKAYVEQPLVATAAKRRAIEVALEGIVSDITLDFLRLLVARDRADQIEAIASEYHRLWMDHEGVETARVTTAVPLTPDEHRGLEGTLSRLTGKRVSVDASVDPSLIGGVIAVVGDRVWDGSVRGSLARLRAALKSQDVIGQLRASQG